MKLLNLPLLILTIGLSLGILIDHYFFINTTYFLYTFTSILVLFFSIYKTLYNWKFKVKFAFESITFILFVCIGILLFKFHHQLNHQYHYSNKLVSSNIIFFKVEDRLKPSNYYEKYIASIRQVNHTSTKGSILIRIPKRNQTSSLQVNSFYLTTSSLTTLKAPLNPDQFDYSTYLKKQYITQQLTLSSDDYKKLSTQQSFSNYAYEIRSYFNQKLSHYSFSSKTLAIINALLLGQRHDIDSQTLANYTKAGAIHILALSGLHVGIIIFLFKNLFSFLLRFKNGAIIRMLLLLSLLWFFAFITGFSPSILRASTMFSFLLIGQQIQSRTSSYNSLIASFFILLCFNPMLLFDVGFQLSYIAVFSILWIHPILSPIYIPKNKLIKLYWDTITVSIAAQVGILPLSLFYFHQFPSLFLITNLVILPFLSIILISGILVILLATLDILPEFVITAYEFIISSMNIFISSIAQQEDFLFTSIYFSWRLLLGWYLVIISTSLLLKKFRFDKVYFVGGSIIALLTVLIIEKQIVSNTSQFIIFHQPLATIIGIHKQQELSILSSDKQLSSENYLFKNYVVNHNIKKISFSSIKNSYRYKQKDLVVIDSTSLYHSRSNKTTILLLRNSPKVNLNRVIHTLKPTIIIADGSNYKSYINRWEITCNAKKIPFHRTDKKGAYVD